ncbi:MAG TPA: hypothetical protein RMH99_10065 [Sandaracinaceae bacterium LLY-WYZ-13_1]|nr:hypothetical protein [Sandaracinaceae bacterium LLY-WYZ-13_1]
MNVRRCWPTIAALTMAAVTSSCGGGSVRLTPSYVAVHNTMTAMGLAQSGEISEGSLPEGGVARMTTRFRAGDCYTIVAFGDDGVSDMDVVVMDDAGTEVATDRTTDSQAAAQFCPDVDGEYRVAVRMTEGSGAYVLTSWSGMPRAAGGAVAGGGSGRGTCEAPIALEPGTPVRGSTAQASNRMTGSCIRGGNAPEVVYSLTLEERAMVSVTINSDYDGALYLLGACGEVRSEIACNDDAPSTSRSQVESTLDPGTYYVVVDGYGNASGEFELLAEVRSLQSLAQVCSSAPPLRSGQAVTGSTQGQPSYFTATCAGGARSPDRVYRLDVSARSRLRLRMQSTYDGAIYVRSDCQDPNSEVACNDDHQDTRHSMLVTTLDPGRYYVYADGFSAGQAGDYSLRADLAPVTGGSAAADQCQSPGTLTPGQDMELDTFPASDDYAGSCGGQGAPDVVYQIDVQNRSRFRARLNQAEFGGALYLQQQCGQSSSEVVCASGRPGARTELDANLQPGTYFLVVDGTAQDQFGAARVEVQLEDLQALERACRSAPRLRPGRTVTGDTGSSRDRFQASCAAQARSNDLVYQLRLRRRSRVRISSEQQYDGAIYIRSDCTDMSTELACNDDHGDNRHSQVEVTLDPGTYYVFVDGFADRNQGSFTLDVDVSRP